MYHRAYNVRASDQKIAFEAFLPRDKKERALVLDGLANETRTIIIYGHRTIL